MNKVLVEVSKDDLWKLALGEDGYPTTVEIYKQALDRWGEKQIIMVFEEMAELQKELCKSLRGRNNLTEIAEEIADVEIMLEQMKIYFNIADGVEKHKKLKLERLEEILGR